ncbi:hybrid sensor histidine kinase/response regulator [Paludibacterium yongneupense]|uniref:hybrid sensor histidine kinase/response regulator n=1 Tax=Paludibacterium yongneupense TaxID=400061 RepID=UPI001B7FB506|nr:ATP-binding protein [Paludibacterium yongneupense]
MDTPPDQNAPVQHIVKIRRDYNGWVARETLEDYALRFTPRRFRQWSEWRVANTAFGAASFLVLEAVGATMMVDAGFFNAFWAILATGAIIFLAGLPISLYAARYGVDMDLLTRGAGFGYIGSTITSLIYASFTFIFFALEAAIMAYALELGFGIPPVWGYLLCALVVLPLVTHGVTVISRLQTWTQPLWLVLLVLPYVFVLRHDPTVLSGLWRFGGTEAVGAQFDVRRFGAALTVGVALITQMGEQADYLRFMPPRSPYNSRRWLWATIIGGPGWVLPGVAKMLGGALLAWLALRNAVPVERAVDPNQMYLVGFSHVFSDARLAIAATTLFVIVSQLKINVTNAYAGSLAWSNFFSRLTHSHPGRVVWVVFNTTIALMLMELEVFQALGQILGLFSNIAISWIMAVVADLMINKPLGLSPAGIEFKRSHLFDINPVGVGAMGLASILSVSAHVGLLGAAVQPLAPCVAMLAALLASSLLACLTRGRYYLARPADADTRRYRRCVVCEREYEAEDMAFCPAYQGGICSLCCTLDARCDDLCKPHAHLAGQWAWLLRRLLPDRLRPYLERGLGHYLLLMGGMAASLALLLGLMYCVERDGGSRQVPPALYLRLFAALLLAGGVAAWWMVLTHKSRQVAQEESNRQTRRLMQEIASHGRTDAQLQQARRDAEQANRAKTRYVSAISHELRTPLNSLLGYAQILDGDDSVAPVHRQALQVIRRSGDHLLSVIEGSMDIARIESGRLSLDTRAVDFGGLINQIVAMFELQASNKGLDFRFEPEGALPAVVRADEKRLRQILINILGNAVKFTVHGSVRFSLRYQREMAQFDIADSGPGMAADELARVFEPFERGSAASGGSGLGLTISKMLVDLMGGELTASSQPGQGSRFSVRLFLPQARMALDEREPQRRNRVGYVGPRRRIMLVDNECVDREMLARVLQPLGFEIGQAESGLECLARLPVFQPHLVFIDLAMPGIDGWETLRRIRRQRQCGARLAVISANAFDKGQDNDAGIADEDFILKPVKVEELLDWIGRALELEWVARPEPSARLAPERVERPPAHELAGLLAALELGYVRGIRLELECLDKGGRTAFVAAATRLVDGFRFEELKAFLAGVEGGEHERGAI